MAQTPATKVALERDNHRCVWCYYRLNRVRGVFDGPWGTSALGGGHHLFGRKNIDVPEAIIGLCSECHSKAEAHKIPECDLISLAEFITHANLHTTYRQFTKCEVVIPWLELVTHES